MSNPIKSGSSWATQTETENPSVEMKPTTNCWGLPKTEPGRAPLDLRQRLKKESSDEMESCSWGASPKSESGRNSLGRRDLRHKLRDSRGCSDGSDASSPMKSPTRPQRRRELQGSDGARPNYVREKDGLSPLRSPLNSEQRSSRVNSGSRRRPLNGDEANKKENEAPASSSPSKKEKYPDASTSPKPPLSEDVEEQRFRRRLNLPAEGESDEEERGVLDPENEEDRITMERRDKQIAYGKSTESYKLYAKTVPKDQRSVDRKRHPRTPIKTCRCSRRNWDAQIKAWKKYTHQWANVNFPSMTPGPKPPKVKSDPSKADAKADVKAESEMEEEDNEDNTDLNEEEDESFLEGFDLDYELGEGPVEAKPVA